VLLFVVSSLFLPAGHSSQVVKSVDGIEPSWQVWQLIVPVNGAIPSVHASHCTLPG
jgi:hypothetical protein